MIKTEIYTYWKSRLLEEAKLYKSLKFMGELAKVTVRIANVYLSTCGSLSLYNKHKTDIIKNM